MGKKQAPAAQKPARAGLDIKQFLERKPAQNDGSGGSGAAARERSLGAARSSGARIATPGRNLLDNVLLSQDLDDGSMQVVWASSPTAALSPQRATLPSQDAPSNTSQQQHANNSQSSRDGFRRTLLQAVQGAAALAEAADNPQGEPQQQNDALATGQQQSSQQRAEQPGAATGAAHPQPQQGCVDAGHGSGQAAPCPDLLEQLLARRRSHGGTSTSAPSARAAGAPLTSAFQRYADRARQAAGLPPVPEDGGDDAMTEVEMEVLASAEAYRTPGSGGRFGSKLRSGLRGGDPSRTPGAQPQSHLLGHKRALVTTNKKGGSGNKRRALLDLLDQVERMVKNNGGAPSSAGPLADKSGPVLASDPVAGEQLASKAVESLEADEDCAPVSAHKVAPGAPAAGGLGPTSTAVCGVLAPRLTAAQPQAATQGGIQAGHGGPREPLRPACHGGMGQRQALQPVVKDLGGPGVDGASEALRDPMSLHPAADGAGSTGAAAPRLPAAEAQGEAPSTDPHLSEGAHQRGSYNMFTAYIAAADMSGAADGRAAPAGALPLRPCPSTLPPTGPQPSLCSAPSAAAVSAVPLDAAPVPSRPLVGDAVNPGSIQPQASAPGGSGPVAANGAAPAAPPPETAGAVVVRPAAAARTQQQQPLDDDDDDWDVDIDALVADAMTRPTQAVATAPTVPQQTQAACIHPGSAAEPTPAPLHAVGAPGWSLASNQLPCSLPAALVTAPAPAAAPLGHTQGPGPSAIGQPVSAAPPVGREYSSASSGSGPAGQGVPGAAMPQARGALPPPPDPGLLGDREEVHFIVMESTFLPHQYVRALRCWSEYKASEAWVYLHDVWADLEVQPGDSVNVIGAQPEPGPARALRITMDEGLLVLHPDILLSGTAITTAVTCQRRAWLQERVAGGPGGEAALVGQLSHLLLQRSLHAALEGTLSKENMMAEARTILSASTDKLQEAHLTEGEVLGRLAQQLDALVAFCAAYVAPHVPGSGGAPQGARLDMGPGGGQQAAGPAFCRVHEVVDIEESIWAPKYGLKGQLDATLRVTVATQDPLHNQRTLAGGYASSLQQQQGRGLASQGGWGADGGGGPPRYHGGQQLQRQQHGRLSDGGLQPMGGPKSQAQGGQGAVAAEARGQVRRQSSWSAGAAPLLPPQAPVHGQQQQQQQGSLPGFSCESMIVPFEFKSGKDHCSHRAQVLLYLLLMEDRYRTAVRTGLLWNINSPTLTAVRYTHGELASLLMHRNRLAAALATGAPPPPLQGGEAERNCKYCAVSATCALYLAADSHQAASAARGAAAGGSLPHGLHPGLSEQVVGVRPACAAFFAHWSRLVDLEEGAARGNQSELWAITGVEREQQGGCISRLQLLEARGAEEGPDGRRYIYVFGRPRSHNPRPAATTPAAVGATPSAAAPQPHATAASGCRSAVPMDTDGAARADPGVQGEPENGSGSGLLDGGFAADDRGVLGVEGRHAQAARVTVLSVTPETITLASNKELRIARLAGQQHAPCSCAGAAGAEACPSGTGATAHRCPQCGGEGSSNAAAVTWRLDRDEAASTFAQMRLNLAKLCINGAGMGWQKAGGGGGGRGGGGGGGGATQQPSQAADRRREAIVQRLRQLVVQLEAPQQGVAPGSGATMDSQAPCGSVPLSCGSGGGGTSPITAGGALPPSLCASAYVRSHAHLLNGEQLEAVQRVLAMNDYAVLLGMPGTGKTTTIVHIIRALVQLGRTVLVASYTNSAVDNILLKLVGSEVPFVRLGQPAAVHPAVRPYLPGGAQHPDTSTAGLKDLMQRTPVVGCTCLSAHHPLLAGRTFSVAILDEASQVTLPASLGPLMLGRSFLLVGDHYQLSPLVVSREAAQGGLGVSLFRRLSEAHPQAVVTLRSQYRMAADIMALSNALVYNGRLLCGSEQVAHATLHLPHLPALLAANPAPGGGSGTSSPSLTAGSGPGPRPMGLQQLPAWLLEALQPQQRVLFLDTDGAGPGCREVLLGDGVTNPGEVRLVAALAAGLVAAGLSPCDIGVASPYKAQVAALGAALADLREQGPAAGGAGAEQGGQQQQQPGEGGNGSGSGVEVLTIDRFQGRDKGAVLLSFVRCNPGRSAGRLLADWQRLNVAITRSRAKLMLVGSCATLGSIPLLRDMLGLLRQRGWVRALPAGCLEELPPVGGKEEARQQA